MIRVRRIVPWWVRLSALFIVFAAWSSEAAAFQKTDIIKLDLGTQVDGYVTDNATTVDLRDGADSLLVKAGSGALTLGVPPPPAQRRRHTLAAHSRG